MLSRQSLSQVGEKVPKQKRQIRKWKKNEVYVGFLQMPNSKYTLASSVLYMTLILTYLLAKKLNTLFLRLRCFRQKTLNVTLDIVMTLP